MTTLLVFHDLIIYDCVLLRTFRQLSQPVLYVSCIYALISQPLRLCIFCDLVIPVTWYACTFYSHEFRQLAGKTQLYMNKLTAYESEYITNMRDVAKTQIILPEKRFLVLQFLAKSHCQQRLSAPRGQPS